MPVQVYEDTWEVESELLESIAPDPARPHDYPYPRPLLRKTGNVGRVSLRTVVLENDFVKVIVVPDLGGRVVQITDKRTGFDLWPRIERLSPKDAGIGPASLIEGLTVFVGSSLHRSSGPVQHSVYEPVSEASSAGVILSGILDEGIDWHVCFSLAPDRSDLLIELRIHNRTLETRLPVSGILLDSRGFVSRQAGNSLWSVNSSRESSLVLSWTFGEVEELAVGDELVSVRFSPATDAFLGPRQVRSHSVRASVLTGEQNLVHAEKGLALSLDGPALSLFSTSQRAGRRVIVQCEDAAQLEATVELGPSLPFRAEFPSPVTGVVVKDSLNEEFHFEEGKNVIEGTCKIAVPLPPSTNRALHAARLSHFKPFSVSPEPTMAEEAFYSALSTGGELPPPTFGLEAATAIAKASRHAKAKAWEKCIEEVERSLNHNAEDQLAWWLKAVAERHANIESEERTSILNARFLAPLDPVLRAEAFLSTPIGEGPGPSPLVKPLALDPDALLDVLSLMIECGLYQDAARLIDECLRHRDTPLVRYIYAWLLLTTTKMQAEAAEQVQKAGQGLQGPPFPHRICEVKAVRELTARFPEDLRLQELGKLTDAFVTWYD